MVLAFPDYSNAGFLPGIVSPTKQHMLVGLLVGILY